MQSKFDSYLQFRHAGKRTKEEQPMGRPCSFPTETKGHWTENAPFCSLGFPLASGAI
jgi:hypothetical protein